jgi:hypothetical protein
VWNFSSQWDKSSHTPKKGGLYEVKKEANLERKIDALTCQVEVLVVSKSMNSANARQVEGCSLCASPMHLTQNCPSSLTFA